SAPSRQPPQNLEQLVATAAPKENPRTRRKRPQPQRRLILALEIRTPQFLQMPAYVIVEIDVIDPIGYEEYKKLASATVEKYGGNYIVPGGQMQELERNCTLIASFFSQRLRSTGVPSGVARNVFPPVR